MAGQENAAPVIIKRKKVIAGGGHHGGAWKVAYADFVTAMMAFFLLMWLLNATTEKQRKGIADYFNPTIPLNRVSGGGDGIFGGDSVFSDQTLAKSGTGAPIGEDAKAAEAAMLGDVESTLLALGGESMTMENALRHVVTKLTDEGLVVELHDLEGAPLFVPDSTDPMPVLLELIEMIAEVFALVSNEVAVNGHVRAYPIMLRNNPVWNLSAARASEVRIRIEGNGLPAARLQRVSGFADRKPVTADPAANRNNRIELILLRRNQ